MKKIGYLHRSGGSTKSPGRFARLSINALFVLAIFGFGFSLGSGRININLPGKSVKPVSQNLPKDLDYTSAEELYDALKQSYDGEMNSTKLLDGLKQGLVRATGDPYSEYFNEAAAKEFEEDLNGTFEGIGAELTRDNELIIVVAPIAGFPAEKAGLKPRDAIVEIDGKNAYGMNVSEAVKLIRGPKGTTVRLKVVRDRKEQLTLEIVRDRISIPSVNSEILEGGIGLVKIARFGDDTVELVRQAATNFKTSNVRGVILDLRGNPGGLLSGAVDVASLWLDNKPVLSERRGTLTIKHYQSRGSATLSGLPTVVLIDEGSASASEIVAGALKDNHAATIIGHKSFGKGSVQDLQKLRGGGELKVTIARWYTPSGKNIDKAGIDPDETVDRTDEDITTKKDPPRDRALEILRR